MVTREELEKVIDLAVKEKYKLEAVPDMTIPGRVACTAWLLINQQTGGSLVDADGMLKIRGQVAILKELFGTEVSSDVARRLIKALIELGVLVADGSGPGRTYCIAYGSWLARQLIERAESFGKVVRLPSLGDPTSAPEGSNIRTLGTSNKEGLAIASEKGNSLPEAASSNESTSRTALVPASQDAVPASLTALLGEVGKFELEEVPLGHRLQQLVFDAELLGQGAALAAQVLSEAGNDPARATLELESALRILQQQTNNY